MLLIRPKLLLEAREIDENHVWLSGACDAYLSDLNRD
jgi:hypothetical protein